MPNLTLKKVHKDGKETTISDLDQLNSASGDDVNCVFALRNDGSIEIFDNASKPLKGPGGKPHPGEPGPPMDDYAVKASQITTAIGPEGFNIRINNNEYVCNSSPGK